MVSAARGGHHHDQAGGCRVRRDAAVVAVKGPLPGTPVVEGFGPLARVGRGGFASVYRAEDVHIGRVVAVKVLEHIDTADPRARDRFLRETRAMGRLSGLPHVVDIYQATFTTDGQPCIVMPFFAGGSLEDRLAESGPLPAGSALAVGVTIARAVDAAHRRGLSHRDIKPGNILIDDRGDVALADFGIAVVEDAAASQRTRTALSPEHAAPERLVTPADGPAPEAWGDQFSLASTVHMLLTGRPPFGLVAETGLHEVLRRIVEAPAPPTGRDDVPAAAEAVLARAMAKQPEARYPSASAFADALAAAGVVLADPPVTAPGRVGAARHGAFATPATPSPAVDAGFPMTAWSSEPLTVRSGTSVTAWSPGPPPYLRTSPEPGPTPAPVAPPDRWSAPTAAPAPTPPPSAPTTPPGPRTPVWPAPGGPALVPPGPPLHPSSADRYVSPPGPAPGVPGPAVPGPDAGHTIVPEHRRIERDRAPAPGASAPASGARRALLVIGASFVLTVAAAGAGYVLVTGKAPSADPTTTAPAPPGPVPPGGSGSPGPTGSPDAAVTPPRIESVQPVDRALVVFWRDDAPRDARGYGWEVTVDGARKYIGNVGRTSDGSWRSTQEITALEDGGRSERIDASAHQYCVVIQRLLPRRQVSSEPVCTTGPKAP
jgi:serine/threonine protein kinase